MRYLYEGHLGNLFSTPYELDYEDCYCDECGDSDYLIGSYETIEEFWNLIENDCDLDGHGGWSLQYVFPLMASEFNLLDRFEMNGEFCGDLPEDEIIERIEQLIGRKIIVNIKNDSLEF